MVQDKFTGLDHLLPKHGFKKKKKEERKTLQKKNKNKPPQTVLYNFWDVIDFIYILGYFLAAETKHMTENDFTKEEFILLTVQGNRIVMVAGVWGG